jgi:hypothetical protein
MGHEIGDLPQGQAEKDSLPKARNNSHTLRNLLCLVLPIVFAPELAPSKATEH